MLYGLWTITYGKVQIDFQLTNPLPSWLPIWDYSYDGTNVDRSGSGVSRPKVFYRKPDTDFLYVGEPLSCEKEMNQ